MRKLVICLLVFGLYAIQTVVGHMNSDPAPGRSPGPPVDFTINLETSAETTATQTTKTLNDKDVLDNNTYNSNNDNNVAQHVNNENVAVNNFTYATTTTLRNNQQLQEQQQQIEINHKNNLPDNHNNNEPEINNSDRESLNDSYRHLVESTKLYSNNHHNDEANEQISNNDDFTNISDNDDVDDDVEEITSSSSSKSSRLEEDAINFQLTKDNNYNSPLDDKNQHKNVNDKKTTNNYPTNGEAAAHVVKDELQEQMTLHRDIDYSSSSSSSNTHEKLHQHTKTIPAISTNTQQHTSSTSLFPASPNFYSSSSSAASTSSSSSSTTHSSSASTYSSCHSDLNDFLNDVTVIEVDDVADDVGNNINDSFSNTSNTSSSTASGTSTSSSTTSTSTLPPLLQGFKIQLQLYHDVFDASTAFGINCGLLYKIRLTTSLPTLITPLQSSASSSSTTTSSATELPLSVATSKHQQKRQPKLQSATAEMQNPTIRQYTGDFFVETVSLSSSQERGTFVTSNTDDDSASNGDDSSYTTSSSSSSSFTNNGGNNGVGGSSSSSSETLGNKLPISWFATSQQHTGNWQLKNNANPYVHTNADALKTKNLYNTNLNSMSVDDDEDVDDDDEDIDLDENIENGQDIVNVAEDGLRKESLEVKEENVDNIPSNGFYKATKKGFKLKQQQQQQQQQRQHQQQQHDTTNNNKWHYVDNVASSSASSSSSRSSTTSNAAKKKRRKSVEIENTTNICSSENKWQGRTKSYTNAAGGISTESLGLWLVNELCEQDDTIEFRVFFRLKIKTNNMRSSSNGNSINNNDTNFMNNVWLNVSGNMGQPSASATGTGATTRTTNVDEAQIVVYRKTFQFQIRKDCHLILRETSMGTLDYTILPLYCIDCTIHFPSYKHLNNKATTTNSDMQQAPPGMLVELQRLNVPCSSGGYVRFNEHKVLCGKLEELEASDRVYHFNVEDNEASVQFYRNPMFSLSYKLVDYCYNVSTSNESGEFYIRPSMKDSLECYFRIHLPYGNRVLLRMVTNNDSDILPMPTLMSQGVDAVQEEELYTIFTSQGTTVDAQVINLTVNSGNNFGAYSSFTSSSSSSSSIMPFKLPDMNATTNLKHMGLDTFGFLAATKANLQMAFSGTANCVGVVIKVFENDHAKWSHCVNNTKHMRGFILESSSNTLSVHLFRAPTLYKDSNIETKMSKSAKQLTRHQMPAIYLSYQARPLPDIVSNCAFGWIAMEQFCIAAIELSLSWHEAEKHCSKLGGHLVSVRTEQQQQLINELLINSPGYSDQNAYWVGGSDKSYEGDFRWSDGLIFQYTNWFPGWSQHGHYNKQPNDDGLSSQDCIELRRYFRTPPGVQSNRSPLTNRYMWNDRDCSANNFLICERPMSDDSLRRNWINDCNKTVSLTKEHPRASIWSPSFPRQYPDNANCYTTITAPAGYRIVIEFEELVIENEQGCTYDYLEITEPKLSESLRSSSTKSTSSKYRYNSPNIDSNLPNSYNANLKFNYNNPYLRSFRKRSSYDSTTSTISSSSSNNLRFSSNSLTEHIYAPQNTDYNGYDLAQNNYQKLLQIYSSLYSPRNNFIIQTPDYPKGNPYLQHPTSTGNSHNHHNNLNSNNNNNRAGQEVLPKRLCGDWSTKLKLLRYVSTGSYLGLHFVSDYSHHFGGYKAKTYMENRSHSFSAASECSNERLKPYNGSCYLFVSYPEVDWWTAQQVCRGMGAKLTSVSSADEHRFITSNIRNQIDYSPQLIYWLGAELEKNGQFEWTDDSRMSFQGWLPGQGQFDVMPSDATCLGLQWKMSPTPMLPSGLYWQSQKCNKVGGYVCKKPKESFGNFAFSNFTVTGSEGRLVSPAYPNTYPLNIDYWIHIKAAERTRIVVQFQKIDLEPQDECLYDFISIQDYDIVSKIILEPGTNTVPMAMLMSDEQFTAYENVDGDDNVGVRNGNPDDVNNDNDGDENDNSNSSDDDDEDNADTNDNGANDNETSIINKGIKKTSNTRLHQQHNHFHHQQQLQHHGRIRRSISLSTYKDKQSKFTERQTENMKKSQNRKRRRKRRYTAKLPKQQHVNIQKLKRQEIQKFKHLPAKTSKLVMHHQHHHKNNNNDDDDEGETLANKQSLQKYNKKSTWHKDSNSKKQQQRQQQQNFNLQTQRKQQNKKNIIVTTETHQHSSSYINENPKRSRRKKSLKTLATRYRRSTILSDDPLPASDNAQSFLPYVRWCGSHESNMSKFDFVSRSNEVMLNFHSDYSITGLGFAAVWKAIDVSGCPLRTLTSREGTIFSPNYPHFLLNNLNCAYVIQAPVGKRVWLEFIEYDFVADALLEIDIGNGLFRPFRLMDHLNDGMFVSLKEQLRVQFRTGQHPRGKGFQAIYHTVGQMERRERIINLTSNDTGYLYQLNYPHDMPENVDFTQHLVAPFGHNIRLELYGVEFTENGCQDNNILEIYDNYADNNGTKWQLCKFQNANFHTSSPPDDNYFTTNMHGQQQQQQQQQYQQHPGEYFSDSYDNSNSNNNYNNNNNLDNIKQTTNIDIGNNMETSVGPTTTTIAEFLLRQQQQQQQYMPIIPPPPPPVYITSYLNTLYIRQRTTAKTIANLNCTIRIQWDNNYKVKLSSEDKSVESCQPNPCQYNGKCVVNNGTSYCQCLGHFTGRFCGLNLCELEPCVFGKCELTTNNFKCKCQPGYMGTTCEQKQRPCADNPCEGRGICIEKNGGFFCRCYAWWEGHRCEKRMLHIPYKPLSERMLQEPFWLGLITVFVVLAVIGLVWCAKRHFPEKIEKLLAEEADRNRPPGSIHGHHHHTSLREQLQFTTAIPQTTVNNAPGAPRSIFNRLGIRKPSLLSLSSPNPIPGGGGAAARTFSLDDLLRPPPRRSPSPRKKRNNSTPVKKNAAEKKQILQQLVSPAAQQAKPKVSLGELISMSENRLRASNVDSESDLKETTFSENTGSLTSATVDRAINDPKLEKKVTFARLLNKVSAEMSSGSEVDIGTMAATRNSSALSLPTDIQMRASSMPPSPCTNDMRSPHSTSSTHGSDSFSSSDLALTDFGLRSIQTSGSEMGSTNNNQLSGLATNMPTRCRIGSPARPKVSSADSILAMFRNFANAAGNASNTTTNTMPSTTSVFVSPSTTPTVSSPQDDAPGDDESSTSSMHTPVSFSSGAPDSPVFYRQTTTIEVPVLDVLNAHKSTTTSSSSSSTSSNLLHPPTILLEIPSINNKCLSPIREMPTPIPSPALTPIMPRPQRSNSPIFQEDPSSGADFSDDDEKSDRSDTQLSEKLRIGLQRDKSRLIDSDVETTPTDTTTTSMANLNKPIGGLNYKIPKLSFTPAIAAAPLQMPNITIDIEPPTPDEKQAQRPRDLIIPTLTVEQPSPTKNRHPMIIFPGSPPPQRASIGETSFMFPNKQQQKRLLKQFEKPTSLDFPFAPPTITVTANMSELESDTEPLSPAPKTVGGGGLMPPNPVGMCYLSPFTMCTRADRTISESNLSSSGYSSMASPGPSRCGSSNPLYPNEMDEPGSGHTGPGLSLHVNLLNRRKSSVLPSCKENISNGKCTGASTAANTDRLHTHRPRSDSETFSDDILMESNDEGIGTDHVDEKLDDTRLSSRRFDMFLDDEILIEVDEPPSTTLPSTSAPLLSGNTVLSTNCGPQMAQLQLPSIVIQIDGCGDKTLSPVSSRSESPLSERAGIGRFSPHFYGRKDQLPFTDSDGLYDFPSSDGKGTSAHTFSHQRRSSSKKRERKSSKCSSTQSPTKQQLDLPSKESLNTSSTPSSITHVCNKHCHSHHHPCPAVTVTTRKSPKRRLLNRHPVASSSSSSESLNSAKELTVRPLPRRLNSPNREKKPRKQESLSEDEVADTILRRISPSIVKEDESVRPKCKINKLRAIGNQIRFLRRLEKSIKTRERIASPSDSCPEENTDDMDSPQASSPLLQPTSPSKTRLALCRQKRLPSGTYGITAAALNSSNWKGMDRSLIGDDLNSD